eukprot:CAMPEP_0179482766 /NCGR_PEP_ID=MMETSP0799-20121207/60177_1 /TAXON_ID=46947 /ORGANISM="Geminigera cryophila, Strain CCMP2564" /LENGTH=544 /DNA_ID=CAMNT_0021296067 /DNA_START=35 /DNA_END=1669 /DNA_ORIENTATION=-
MTDSVLPLLPTKRGAMAAHRLAIVAAGACALLAVAFVAAAVHTHRHTSFHSRALLQAVRSGRGKDGEAPVKYYYIPAFEAKALVAQQQQLWKRDHEESSAAPRERRRTETVAHKPSTPAVKKAVQRMQLPDNFHWGTDGHGLDPEWSCSVPNLIALYNFVQPEWEKCKDNGNYIEPNVSPQTDSNATNATDTDEVEEEAPADAAAAPSTLGWLYSEVEGHSATSADVVKARKYKAEAQRFVKHHLLSGPTAAEDIQGYFSGRRLLSQAGKQELTDWDKAPVLDTSSATMQQCLDFALGNLCSMLSSCDDPVCDNYYNETEIEGLCGMCEMRVGDKDKGCFASHASVATASRGEVTIGDLRVGDEVRAAADGVVVWTRVVFTHDHPQPVATLELFVGNAREGDGRERRIELTAPHLIHVLEREGGVVEGGVVKVEMVRDVRVARSHVRYVVTDKDMLLVDGVVATVYSTAAGWVETMPFRVLDRVLPGVFGKTGVKAALMAVLESPLLHVFEKLVNSVSSVSAPPLVRTSELARRLVVPVGVSTI